MTDIERFNLIWLCQAMTVPTKCDEQYYYDGHSKRFFYSKTNNLGHTQLFDMVDLSMAKDVSNELLPRLHNIDSHTSKIVEIPRLNVQDKVNVQLLFLSKFPGVVHEEELRLAVEQQKDKYGFVLDIITTKYDVLTSMEPYWEDFMLKTMHYYLEKFTGVVGIAFRLTQ